MVYTVILGTMLQWCDCVQIVWNCNSHALKIMDDVFAGKDFSAPPERMTKNTAITVRY